MIREWLDKAATRRPNHSAIRCVSAEQTVSFRELRERVDQESLRFKPGERVCLSPARRIDDVCRLFGVIAAGAVPQLGSDQAGPLPPQGTLVRLFSSGSTGEPKPIDLTAVQVRASVQASAARLQQSPADSWGCVLPLHHVGGLSILLRCLHSQSEVVLVSGSFDAQRCARLCREGRVSQISLVPTQLQRMLPFFREEGAGERLRLILLGGAAAPAELVENCRLLGLPIARTWGMSECASQVATEEPGSFSDTLSPLPGVTVSKDLASGRLLIEGAIAPNGSFLSSDVGEVSEAGVRVEGRVDDICVSGGENLSMARIQRLLLEHPLIHEAVVIKRPSAEWGERPHAVIVASQEEVDEDQIAAFLLERGLRKRELPDSVEWRSELPRNDLGKVRRGEL